MLGACSSTGVKSTQHKFAASRFSHSATAVVIDAVPPSDQQLEAWFATAKSWVEQETQTPLASVTLNLTSREEMAEIGETTLSQLFVDSPISYSLLKKLKQRNSGYSKPSIVALFDPVLNSILLPREGLAPFSRTVGRNKTSFQDAYTALFVHELVHAADYAQYPKNIIFSQKNLGNLAVRAVVEGHAQYLTRKLCEKWGCEEGYRTLRDDVVSAPAGTANPDSNPAAQAGLALSNFCYLHGESFFAAIASHEGATEQVLTDPPTDPVMIRYPKTYLEGLRARKQSTLTDAFRSVSVPWNPDRSLMLHNTNFVPFEGYNPRRQLAQNNYEVLHEGENGVDTTNINIFWKSSASAATSFYRRLLKPSKKRLSSDGRYEVRLLKKSVHEVPIDVGGAAPNALMGRLGAMEFGYQPTKSGLQSNMQNRVQQIFVGTTGPFVVSVARFSPIASNQGLRSYTAGLLRALQEAH